MRSALIINGSGFTPCSDPCSSLTTLLREAHLFDAVHETFVDSLALEKESVRISFGSAFRATTGRFSKLAAGFELGKDVCSVVCR